MRIRAFTFLIFGLFCVIHQCQYAAAYRSEVEITPSPIEEPTTKKSGFFGGIKNFFRGSPTSTTTVAPEVAAALPPKQADVNSPSGGGQNSAAHNNAAHRPPPLNIPNAPLMPLGPRPDTPPTSPLSGNQHLPPQWPQAAGSSSTPKSVQPQYNQQNSFSGGAAHQQFGGSSAQQPFNQQTPFGGGSSFGAGGAYGQRPSNANAAQPSMPPGFAPYKPQRPLPSGVDLSYGGGRPQNAGNNPGGSGLAPLTSSTTTTTARPQTPQQSQQPGFNFDLRGNFASSTSTTKKPTSPHDDFPSLPAPRRPSVGAKEDFPALPVPKSPSSPTPASRPASPSAWNVPLPTSSTPLPVGGLIPSSTIASVPARPGSPLSSGGGERVSFVPHSGSTTTVRPGATSSGNSLATDAEIQTLTESLYTKEVNNQLNLIQVNIQGKTRSIDSADEAPQPLLEVDPKAFESNTIAKMRVLFNNYETDTLVNEHVTPNERKEENDFLDAVMATSVMRQAMQFLQSKNLVSPDPKTHRDLVKELWFTQYSRGSGKVGSSGFEHVFVNEVKNGTIIGLHNWVYFYDEEKAGHLDYKGYLKTQDMGTKGKILKVRFTHNNLNKPVNTLFIGTSPELELALYTVCFQLRPDRTCNVSLGNSKFGIVTYSWRYRGKSLIGSAYPEI